MHASSIPRKTELARAVLQSREFPGTRAQRLFLIMVDGRKPLRELAEAAAQLNIDDASLQALVDAQLLEWVPRSTGRKSADESAAGASHEGVAAPVGAAVATRAPRSMAAAKMFVLDLATLMLQGQDREVRDAAREMTDAPQMKAWLDATADRIARRAGNERADAFLRRVFEVLPDDVAALYVDASTVAAG